MQHASMALTAVLLAATCLSCGGFTAFVATDGHSATFLSTSGTVSVVQLTVVDGQTTVTAVTLVNQGFATTTNFCGNVVSQFPIDSFVHINFNSGNTCATVVAITSG